MPFASKAQQRFAYATKQPWRHEWSEATKKTKKGFAGLPQHVRHVHKSEEAPMGESAFGIIHDYDIEKGAPLGQHERSTETNLNIEHQAGEHAGKPHRLCTRCMDPRMRLASRAASVAKRGGCPNPYCELGGGHGGDCQVDLEKAFGTSLLDAGKTAWKGAQTGFKGGVNLNRGGAASIGHTLGAAAKDPVGSLGRAASTLKSPKVVGTAAGLGAVGGGARALFRAARTGKTAGAAAGETAGTLGRAKDWVTANPGKAALAGGGGLGLYALGRRNS